MSVQRMRHSLLPLHLRARLLASHSALKESVVAVEMAHGNVRGFEVAAEQTQLYGIIWISKIRFKE